MRIVSRYFRFISHHKRSIIFSCLACLALLACPPQLQAQKDNLRIFFRDTYAPETGTIARKLYEEIKDRMRTAITYNDKFRSDFSISDDPDADSPGREYSIEFTIDGPDPSGCYWRVACEWRSGENLERQLCWSQPATIHLSEKPDFSDFDKIDCLVNFINLRSSSAQELPLTGNYCEKPKKKQKIIYVKHFEVDIRDDDWKAKVKQITRDIPVKLMIELENDFEKYGFTIRPGTNDFDYTSGIATIGGYIIYEPQAYKLVIWLETCPSKGILKKLKGRTEVNATTEERFLDIKTPIVDYIRKRLHDE